MGPSPGVIPEASGHLCDLGEEVPGPPKKECKMSHVSLSLPSLGSLSYGGLQRCLRPNASSSRKPDSGWVWKAPVASSLIITCMTLGLGSLAVKWVF